MRHPPGHSSSKSSSTAEVAVDAVLRCDEEHAYVAPDIHRLLLLLLLLWSHHVLLESDMVPKTPVCLQEKR